MTSLSRVMSAIGGRATGSVVRGELILDPVFASDYLNWRGRPVEAHGFCETRKVLACCRDLELDLIGLSTGGQGADGDLGRLVDGGLAVLGVVDGVFQRAAARKGVLSLLGRMADAPDAVGADLGRHCAPAIAEMAGGVAAGARGIVIADDIAHRQGTLMSPDWLGQYLLPAWQSLVAAGRELGVPVLLHADGNLNRVLPLIAAAGFDGLQGLEPAAGMDIADLSRRYGRRLCLMGNIDPALLYAADCDPPPGAGDQGLRRAVARWMAGAGSGAIFGTCSGLFAGMSPQRVHRLYRLVAELDPAGRALSPPADPVAAPP